MEEEILEEEIQVQEENYIKADLSDYYTKEETNDLLNEKADIEDIPDISGKQDLITSTNKLQSDLISDSSQNNLFVTSAEKNTWNNKSNFSGNYNDLTNKPTIPVVPTNVSSFTNDSNYQNATQVQNAINLVVGNINEVLATLTTISNGGN